MRYGPHPRRVWGGPCTGTIVERQKSQDINHVDYLLTSKDPTIQEAGTRLKRIGVLDISKLHSTKKFNIPLSGSQSQMNTEVRRLQMYVNKKRESAARDMQQAAVRQSVDNAVAGTGSSPDGDGAPARDRGYSTPFTSPTDIANSTWNLVEIDDSYPEGDSYAGVHPADETILHREDERNDQGILDFVSTLTRPNVETEKRKRSDYSPGEELPPAKAGTVDITVLCRKNEQLMHQLNEMSANTLSIEAQLKSMKEEMEESKRIYLEELQKTKEEVKRLEEVIVCKQLTIDDYAKYHKKAENEETYTQVMGQ